jgi:catechol 2,3-dioxygenase-like lactoylglutathione lyase family enzyme
MAKIRHIAVTTENPDQVAEFYKTAFEMQEVGRNERQVLLSDGYINLTILKWKTEIDADVGANGPNYSGIHHIGFQVDDLDAACAKLEKASGELLTTREGADASRGTPRRQRAEMKWAGPDGVVIDISQPGWVVS